MPTSRQYRLYEPVEARIIVATAPTFYKDQRLKWDWQETLRGHKVVPFDPMEPVRAPEAPEATGPNRDTAAGAVPKRPSERSPTRSPEQSPERVSKQASKGP
jgi:hypothetical protein